MNQTGQIKKWGELYIIPQTGQDGKKYYIPAIKKDNQISKMVTSSVVTNVHFYNVSVKHGTTQLITEYNSADFLSSPFSVKSGVITYNNTTATPYSSLIYIYPISYIDINSITYIVKIKTKDNTSTVKGTFGQNTGYLYSLPINMGILQKGAEIRYSIQNTSSNNINFNGVIQLSGSQ